MANGEFQGLLGQFGLPTTSPHEELAARARALHTKNTAGLAPNDTSLASMGRRLGSGFGAMYANRELPESEQAKYELVSSVTESMEKYKMERPEEWAMMPVQQRGLLFQKKLAEAAMERGMYDVGMPAAMSYFQQQKALEKQDMELRKLSNEAQASEELPEQATLRTEGMQTANEQGVLGLESTRLSNRGTRLRNRLSEMDVAAATRGELKTVWPQGATDPTDNVSAFIDADGNAIVLGTNEPLPPGAYTITPPPTARGGRGSKEALASMTPSAIGQMRERQATVLGTIRGGMLLKEALEQSMTEEGNINIMGGAGGAKSWVIRAADNARALGRSFNIKTSGGVEGARGVITDPDSAGRFLSNNKEYSELLDDVLQDSAPELRRGTRAHARYKAALTHLAYVFARANEPSGARQLSDLDFKNAIEMIGANATDPDVLREVLLDRVTAATEDFELSLLQVGPEATNAVFAPAAQKLYEERKSEFYDAFGQEFGTATIRRPGMPAGEGQLSEEERDELLRDIVIPPRIED